MPADQCFRADDAVVFEVDFRLVKQLELIALDRACEFGLQAGTRFQLLPEATVEDEMPSAV